MSEDTVFFGTPPFLVGVITDPEAPEQSPERPAVILLNAGRVHRVGPSRLYVKIARRLAAAGFVVLRFDFSGIGDSSARHDHLPFDQSVIQETQDVMHCVSKVRGNQHFILMGLCSGANSALYTASCDPRVVGVVLINAQPVPSEELRVTLLGREFVRYFWRIFWRPPLWGRALHQEYADGFRRVRKILHSQFTKACIWRSASMQDTMEKAAAKVISSLQTLIERNTRLLLVSSEDDLGLDYLEKILRNKTSQFKTDAGLDIRVIPQSDHIFTAIQSQEMLVKVILDWIVVMGKNANRRSI